MSNKVKDMSIKSNFFNDIINNFFFDQNDIKIDEKSYKSFPIYDNGYVTV